MWKKLDPNTEWEKRKHESNLERKKKTWKQLNTDLFRTTNQITEHNRQKEKKKGNTERGANDRMATH